MRMKDRDNDGFEVSKEDFDDVIEKFKSKQTKVYDFLIKADHDYKHAIFLLCKKFLDAEEFPDKFRETLLVMIWKKKGPAEILKNNRFVHMKHHLARTCEALAFKSSKTRYSKSQQLIKLAASLDTPRRNMSSPSRVSSASWNTLGKDSS